MTADGGMRDVEFVGRTCEALVAGGSLESAQSVEWREVPPRALCVTKTYMPRKAMPFVTTAATS